MSRPDWIPEEWDYGLYPFVGSCFYCNARATHAADSLTLGRTYFWCDSPDCEASARRAITGEAG